MKKPSYWNHNTAYYAWIRKSIAGRRNILDIGCGDGSLAAYLDDGTRQITGIDPDAGMIRRASSENSSAHIQYNCSTFEAYQADVLYDAVIFSASLHHMDMARALAKAKGMLAPGGMIVIAGLARPSTPADHAVELLRVIPSGIISAARRMRAPEDMGIVTSYELPDMAAVRRTVNDLLPGAVIRYGLHYRYLVKWAAGQAG